MRLLSLLCLTLAAACSNAANPTPDASEGLIDASMIDAGPPLGILMINEVAPGETPDWIEVVNVTSSPVQLDEYCFVDVADDAAKCKAFPTLTLAPGAYHAQDVSTALSGFGLGSDEELWVYRIADQRVSDSVDWAEGAAPAESTFARLPDTIGAFQTTNMPTRGAANLAANPNPALKLLVVNEIASGETPDWIEIVNVTNAPISRTVTRVLWYSGITASVVQ